MNTLACPRIDISACVARIILRVPRLCALVANSKFWKLVVTRAGSRQCVAEYALEKVDGDDLVFFVDNNLTDQPPGHYLGAVTNGCEELGVVPMYKRRQKITRASTEHFTHAMCGTKCAPETPPDCTPCAPKDPCAPAACVNCGE